MAKELPVPVEPEGNGFISKLSQIYGWGRIYSLWPMSFGLACCVFEFFATAAARWDFARWGMDLARASPRQADLFVISGTVTKKMVPQVVRLYEQMAEPKYVISMGSCANSGGPYWQHGYHVLKGVDQIVPVDVYNPGCPPRPEALLEGIMHLQKKIREEKTLGKKAS